MHLKTGFFEQNTIYNIPFFLQHCLESCYNFKIWVHLQCTVQSFGSFGWVSSCHKKVQHVRSIMPLGRTIPLRQSIQSSGVMLHETSPASALISLGLVAGGKEQILVPMACTRIIYPFLFLMTLPPNHAVYSSIAWLHCTVWWGSGMHCQLTLPQLLSSYFFQSTTFHFPPETFK